MQETKGQNLIDVEELLELRKGNRMSYWNMVEHLIPAIVGNVELWGGDEAIRIHLFSYRVSITSEAFTILCFEQFKSKLDSNGTIVNTNLPYWFGGWSYKAVHQMNHLHHLVHCD